MTNTSFSSLADSQVVTDIIFSQLENLWVNTFNRPKDTINLSNESFERPDIVDHNTIWSGVVLNFDENSIEGFGTTGNKLYLQTGTLAVVVAAPAKTKSGVILHTVSQIRQFFLGKNIRGIRFVSDSLVSPRVNTVQDDAKKNITWYFAQMNSNFQYHFSI